MDCEAWYVCKVRVLSFQKSTHRHRPPPSPSWKEKGSGGLKYKKEGKVLMFNHKSLKVLIVYKECGGVWTNQGTHQYTSRWQMWQYHRNSYEIRWNRLQCLSLPGILERNRKNSVVFVSGLVNAVCPAWRNGWKDYERINLLFTLDREKKQGKPGVSRKTAK